MRSIIHRFSISLASHRALYVMLSSTSRSILAPLSAGLSFIIPNMTAAPMTMPTSST
jgi:hypothetical protein